MNQLRTKYLLTAVLIFVILSIGKAQSLSVTQNNTYFIVNTAAQAETNTTTNSPSFTINALSNSSNKSYSLSIGAVPKNFISSASTFSSVPLKVTFRSATNVTNTQPFITGPIQLVESTQPNTTLSSSITNSAKNTTAAIAYDLSLSPIGYSTLPGSYIYTVTVRYTDGPKSYIDFSFDVTITVQEIMSLALTQNTLPTFNFATPSQFTNGISMDNASTFTVKSNKAWVFTANSNTANFSNSGTYSTTMPASLLNLKVGTTQSALSTTPQQLNAGTATAGTSFNMSYNANVGYTYGPGNYTITITYTLTGQ